MPGAVAPVGLALAGAFPPVQPVNVGGPWPRGSGRPGTVDGAPYAAIDLMSGQRYPSRRRRTRRSGGLTADMAQSLWAALHGAPLGGPGPDRDAIRAYEPLFDHLGLLVDLLV
jgi:hypothetical protein